MKKDSITREKERLPEMVKIYTHVTYIYINNFIKNFQKNKENYIYIIWENAIISFV